GYRRVFWQGSTDHRGTPKRPGRTVTLTADNDPCAITWGVAYQLAGSPEEQATTLSYLEWREKEYDVRQYVDICRADGSVAIRGALVYIASPSNRNYLGPADLGDIAVQIATSKGPSGPNYEYLFKLADAMRTMRIPLDADLHSLEEAVRQELSTRRTTASVAGTGCDLASPALAAAATSAGRALLREDGEQVEDDDDEEEQEEEEEVVELDHHVDYRRRHQQGLRMMQAGHVSQQQAQPQQHQQEQRQLEQAKQQGEERQQQHGQQQQQQGAVVCGGDSV
ncbi:hypothetical protein Agub_g11434, partial [Astrephomene gubernaculifera]